MRLLTKFFVGGDNLVRADRLEVEPEELTALAQQHAAWMEQVAGDELWMIEVEVLDDPTDPGRFVRFGTDEAGMVDAIRMQP